MSVLRLCPARSLSAIFVMFLVLRPIQVQNLSSLCDKLLHAKAKVQGVFPLREWLYLVVDGTLYEMPFTIATVHPTTGQLYLGQARSLGSWRESPFFAHLVTQGGIPPTATLEQAEVNQDSTGKQYSHVAYQQAGKEGPSVHVASVTRGHDQSSPEYGKFPKRSIKFSMLSDEMFARFILMSDESTGNEEVLFCIPQESSRFPYQGISMLFVLVAFEDKTIKEHYFICYNTDFGTDGVLFYRKGVASSLLQPKSDDAPQMDLPAYGFIHSQRLHLWQQSRGEIRILDYPHQLATKPSAVKVTMRVIPFEQYFNCSSSTGLADGGSTTSQNSTIPSAIKAGGKSGFMKRYGAGMAASVFILLLLIVCILVVIRRKRSRSRGKKREKGVFFWNQTNPFKRSRSSSRASLKSNRSSVSSLGSSALGSRKTLQQRESYTDTSTLCSRQSKTTTTTASSKAARGSVVGSKSAVGAEESGSGLKAAATAVKSSTSTVSSTSPSKTIKLRQRSSPSKVATIKSTASKVNSSLSTSKASSTRSRL